MPKGSSGASASTRRRKAELVSSGTSHTSVACGMRANVNSAAERTSAVRMPQLSRNSSASTPSTASAVTTASSGGPANGLNPTGQGLVGSSTTTSPTRS